MYQFKSPESTHLLLSFPPDSSINPKMRIGKGKLEENLPLATILSGVNQPVQASPS